MLSYTLLIFWLVLGEKTQETTEPDQEVKVQVRHTVRGTGQPGEDLEKEPEQGRVFFGLVHGAPCHFADKLAHSRSPDLEGQGRVPKGRADLLDPVHAFPFPVIGHQIEQGHYLKQAGAYRCLSLPHTPENVGLQTFRLRIDIGDKAGFGVLDRTENDAAGLNQHAERDLAA